MDPPQDSKAAGQSAAQKIAALEKQLAAVAAERDAAVARVAELEASHEELTHAVVQRLGGKPGQRVALCNLGLPKGGAIIKGAVLPEELFVVPDGEKLAPAHGWSEGVHYRTC